MTNEQYKAAGLNCEVIWEDPSKAREDAVIKFILAAISAYDPCEHYEEYPLAVKLLEEYKLLKRGSSTPIPLDWTHD